MTSAPTSTPAAIPTNRILPDAALQALITLAEGRL
jgi:hypothetical protein